MDFMLLIFAVIVNILLGVLAIGAYVGMFYLLFNKEVQKQIDERMNQDEE